VLHEVGERRVIILHDGHGRHRHVVSAEVLRQAQAQEVAEEGEGEGEVRGHFLKVGVVSGK